MVMMKGSAYGPGPSRFDDNKKEKTVTKYVATQDHAGRFGRFEEGQEIDTDAKGSPHTEELCEAAAEAGVLKPVRAKGDGAPAKKAAATKKAAAKKAETAAKDPDAETR